MAESHDASVREFSAKLSEDKTRAEISISFVGAERVGPCEMRVAVRLTREETFKFGQTLLLMTGSMRDA